MNEYEKHLQMSVRPTNAVAVPSASVLSTPSRLNTVLALGMRFGMPKRVEFDPNDPKSSSIPRNCISVNWKLYGGNPLPIHVYLTDVAADPRLKQHKFNNSALNEEFYASKSLTQTEDMQNYANAQNALRVVGHHPSRTQWVLKFVVSTDFARYCLVPIESSSIAERLKEAIEHLDTYMTDDAMRIGERVDNKSVSIKTEYKSLFTAALKELYSKHKRKHPDKE